MEQQPELQPEAELLREVDASRPMPPRPTSHSAQQSVPEQERLAAEKAAKQERLAAANADKERLAAEAAEAEPQQEQLTASTMPPAAIPQQSLPSPATTGGSSSMDSLMALLAQPMETMAQKQERAMRQAEQERKLQEDSLRAEAEYRKRQQERQLKAKKRQEEAEAAAAKELSAREERRREAMEMKAKAEEEQTKIRALAMQSEQKAATVAQAATTEDRRSKKEADERQNQRQAQEQQQREAEKSRSSATPALVTLAPALGTTNGAETGLAAASEEPCELCERSASATTASMQMQQEQLVDLEYSKRS